MKCQEKIERILPDDTKEVINCPNETNRLVKNRAVCRECCERIKKEKDALYEDIQIHQMSHKDLLEGTLFIKSQKREIPEKMRKKITGKLMKKELKKRMNINQWGIGIKKLKELQNLANALEAIDHEQRGVHRTQGHNTETSSSNRPTSEGNQTT